MTQQGTRRGSSTARRISAVGDVELLAVATGPVTNAQGLERAKGGALQFTEEQLRRIDGIVAKANPKTTARLEQLHVQLSELLVAIGIIDDGTEYSREFRKLAREEEDHAEKARRFRKIASAGTPLKPKFYIDNMMAELRVALRQPPKQGDPIQVPLARAYLAASHAQHSVAAIQGAARHLAFYHQSQVSRGPRAKHALDTLLDELADIYAIITGYTKHRHCLSLSERSLFGKFCHAVLQPHCTASESSFSALSARWERIKEHTSRPAERVRRAPKRALRPRKKQEPTTT
jgi:hypothetical protein